MKFNYSSLSAGYVGEACENATLNSQYYNLLFFEDLTPDHFSEFMIFPQKIPRAEFFKELYSLETIDFREKFDKKVLATLNNHLISIQNLVKNNSEKNARCYINLSHLLLRYGRFEHIIKNSLKDYSGYFSLEIEILIETAKIELLLSHDKPIVIDQQLKLAEKLIYSDNATDREKLILLNQLVVNYYRHQKKSPHHEKIFKLSQFLLNLLEKFESGNFLDMFYSSIAFRGLAMVTDFGHKKQNNIAIRAEKIARQLPAKTPIEKSIAGDNLFTCIQTMSKWNLYNKDIASAENYFHELTIIDPYDSIGHSELGFFHIKTKCYDRAAENFKKAMELGPPGAGMNAYFYAGCLEKLGREHEFIHYLNESIRLDSQAVSPWLDLMNYYINKKQNDKAKKIANQLYQSHTLFEQLEEDEKIIIQNFI